MSIFGEHKQNRLELYVTC